MKILLIISAGRNISFCDQKHKQIFHILNASISVTGGLGGCLNAFLSLCVNQLSNVCSIKQICGSRQLVDSDNNLKVVYLAQFALYSVLNSVFGVPSLDDNGDGDGDVNGDGDGDTGYQVYSFLILNGHGSISILD